MNRIEKETIGDKELLIVNFSDCKESEMIEVVHDLKNLVLSLNKPIMILVIYNSKSYATPRFMREVEAAARETNHLLEMEVVVGLSQTKKMILKGYNFLFKKNVQSFDTKEEAIKYILGEIS